MENRMPDLPSYGAISIRTRPHAGSHRGLCNRFGQTYLLEIELKGDSRHIVIAWHSVTRFHTEYLRADQFEHLRDALLAELNLLRAVSPCDDDAGHAHRTIMVLELGEVRNIVGLGAHGRVQ